MVVASVLPLNIGGSGNFSDFETGGGFVLSSCEEAGVVVREALSSATSVRSSLIVSNRVWTTSVVKVVVCVVS